MRVYLALCLPNALACGNLALTFIKNVLVQVGQFPTRGNSLTPWCSHLLCCQYIIVSLEWCTAIFFQMWCVLWHQKNYGLILFYQNLFSQYFTGMSEFQHAIFSEMESCLVRPWCYITFWLLWNNCTCYMPQVVLGSWTTLLLVLFTPLSVILQKEHLAVAMRCLWCNTLVMRRLFISHQFRLN